MIARASSRLHDLGRRVANLHLVHLAAPCIPITLLYALAQFASNTILVLEQTVLEVRETDSVGGQRVVGYPEDAAFDIFGSFLLILV